MGSTAQTRPEDVEATGGTVGPEADTAFEGVEEVVEGYQARPDLGREAGLWADAWRELIRNPLFLISAFFILLFTVVALWPSLFTDTFYPGDPNPRNCPLSRSLDRPSAQHWFGFDLQGCDYYTRTVHGARVSMLIGVSVVGAAMLIAIVFGSLAGYYGGVWDSLIARVTDVWFAIPTLLGAIVVLAALRNPEGTGVANLLGTVFGGVDRATGTRGFGAVSFVLIVLGWPTMLRIMRSSVLEKREADYVDAARALGGSDLRIMLRHILPNGLAPVIVYATILVGIIIAVEATLSFLGVGLILPAISWGLMINGSQLRILTSPHLLFFPGLFLSVTVLSFIMMGDALRDALDPKLR